MKLFKVVLSSLAILLLTVNIALAAGGTALKLGEVVFKKTQLINLLTDAGVNRKNAIRMQRYAEMSLNSFMLNNKAVTNADELSKFLEKVDLDLAFFLRTAKASDLKGDKAKLVDTLSKIYYAAGTHGRRGSFLVVCGSCASDSLKEENLRFTLEELFDGKTGNIFTKMIDGENSNVKIRRSITRDLKKIGVNAKDVDEIDVRPLAIFLELRRTGSKAQKEYINNVLELAKTGNKEYGNLLENRLWNNIDLFDNTEHLPGWNKLLKDTKTNMEKYPGDSVKDAWYRTLDQRAKGDDAKVAKVQDMRDKDCFFKKVKL